MDILQDIRDAMTKAMDSGMSFKSFQKEIEPILRAKGWWGKQVVNGKMVQLGSPWRMKTIYQTNMQSAMNAGRYKAQLDNADNRPFLMYVAVMDSKTRPEHAALHGTIKPVDSPWWKVYYPEWWPFERITKQYRKFKALGFARMMFLDLEATKGLTLKKEWLHYYPADQVDPSWPVYLGVDYASTRDKLKQRNRDFCSIAIMRAIPGGGLGLASFG